MDKALFDGIILFSKDQGVYLGSFIGLGFWSNLDSVGQVSAVTFKNESEAKRFVESWECEPPADLQYLSVKTVSEHSATIKECVEAGADAWVPDTEATKH